MVWCGVLWFVILCVLRLVFFCGSSAMAVKFDYCCSCGAVSDKGLRVTMSHFWDLISLDYSMGLDFTRLC